MSSIFYNLIDNACIHITNEPCAVSLSIDEISKTILFEIRDRGQGFSKDKFQIHRQFQTDSIDVFNRADQFKNGLGIGIPAVRLLVIKLNGEISFHTSDEGTYIKVSLPFVIPKNKYHEKI